MRNFYSKSDNIFWYRDRNWKHVWELYNQHNREQILKALTA